MRQRLGYKPGVLEKLLKVSRKRESMRAGPQKLKLHYILDSAMQACTNRFDLVLER